MSVRLLSVMKLAKLSPVLLGLALVGCAIEEPQTSQVESAATKPTQLWDTTNNNINQIWPATIGGGIEVKSNYVLVKRAPNDNVGNAQVLAFVVWNTNVVGHVYRVRYSDLADFDQLRDLAFAQRAAFDHWSGGAGSIDVPPPTPRCCLNGDEWDIQQSELNSAKLNAGVIHGANQEFTNVAVQQ